MGVYSSNHVNIFVDFYSGIVRKAQYLYLISIRDRSDKQGIYWCSIIDIHPEKLFLFDSFGIVGLQNVVNQNNESLVKKILNRIEKITQTDNKATIVKTNFSRLVYNALEDKKLVKLSVTAKNIFYFSKILSKT